MRRDVGKKAESNTGKGSCCRWIVAGMRAHHQAKFFKLKNFYLESKDMLPTLLQTDGRRKEKQTTSKMMMDSNELRSKFPKRRKLQIAIPEGRMRST